MARRKSAVGTTIGKQLSSGERTFQTFTRTHGLPEPLYNYVFHPERNWQLDAAYPHPLTNGGVAIEIEGGVWLSQKGGKSRHTTGTGFIEDCWKYSAAAAMGWSLLRFTPDMIRHEPDRCATLIREALNRMRYQ